MTSKYKSVLMSASTLDSNNKMVILAQAILPGESSEYLSFFLKHFKQSVMAKNVIFFISDRDKGLINAVSRIFPGIPHAKCLRQLAENFKKEFGKEATQLLYCMAKAYAPGDFNFFYNEVTKGNPKIRQWIERNDPTMWCRSLFLVPRYGVTTSNTIEIVFSVIRDKKHLPFLPLLLHIESYVLEKRYEALQACIKMENDCLEICKKALDRYDFETQ